MKDVNKKFKEDIIHVGVASYDYVRIPFTSPRLNWMTFGGLPVGKLIEFYGEAGSGKTTTALDSVANYMHSDDDRRVLYVDAEHTLDTVWASKLGVDVSKLILIEPTNQGAEEIFQIALDAMDTGEVGLVVIDSLGVMVSVQAQDKTLTEKTYGGISAALTQFSEKAVGLCNKHKCTLIGINQQREDLRSMFGGMKTVGGEAWRFNVSVRIEFRKGKFFDANGNELTQGAENPAGNYVMATMTKNKTCPPLRRQGRYTLNYIGGIDYFKDLVEVAIESDNIIKSSAWYSILDKETGEELAKVQGVQKVYEYLSEHEDVLKKIEDEINKQIQDLEYKMS